MVDVSGVSGQITNLQEKNLNYEESLLFTAAVHLLQNFYTPSRPTFPVLWKQLLLGLCGGLFLAGCMAFYLNMRRKLRLHD